jgi:poly-beta-1,6-N-acetyl-D-glucosamine biosynthesis protein PgaD
MVLTWIYLCIPLITFAAWYVAYTFFDQHLLLLEGYKEYKTPTSLWYVGIIAAMLVFVLAWSKGNKMLASDKDAQQSRDLSLAESSRYYQQDEDRVIQYRRYKNMTVSFDDQGKIVKVDQGEG